jgi:hypothetical protein
VSALASVALVAGVIVGVGVDVDEASVGMRVGARVGGASVGGIAVDTGVGAGADVQAANRPIITRGNAHLIIETEAIMRKILLW